MSQRLILINEYIDRLTHTKPDPGLLQKGKQAYNLFKSEILKYNKQ